MCLRTNVTLVPVASFSTLLFTPLPLPTALFVPPSKGSVEICLQTQFAHDKARGDVLTHCIRVRMVRRRTADMHCLQCADAAQRLVSSSLSTTLTCSFVAVLLLCRRYCGGQRGGFFSRLFPCLCRARQLFWCAGGVF